MPFTIRIYKQHCAREGKKHINSAKQELVQHSWNDMPFKVCIVYNLPWVEPPSPRSANSIMRFSEQWYQSWTSKWLNLNIHCQKGDLYYLSIWSGLHKCTNRRIFNINGMKMLNSSGRQYHFQELKPLHSVTLNSNNEKKTYGIKLRMYIPTVPHWDLGWLWEIPGVNMTNKNTVAGAQLHVLWKGSE